MHPYSSIDTTARGDRNLNGIIDIISYTESISFKKYLGILFAFSFNGSGGCI